LTSSVVYKSYTSVSTNQPPQFPTVSEDPSLDLTNQFLKTEMLETSKLGLTIFGSSSTHERISNLSM
jgi:hypothetical protein